MAGNGTVNNAGPPTFAATGPGSQIGVDLINAQLGARTNVTLDTSSAAVEPGNILEPADHIGDRR